MAELNETQRGIRKQRKGVVVSRSGDKSLVVVVERHKRHPLYGKVMKTRRKFHVHDADNVAGVGDTVRIVESRPISKLKRWRLAEILEKASA